MKVGGGANHRFALFDGVLIKDSHISACGGVEAAVLAARRSVHHLQGIEVEASNLIQVREALAAGADAIMLDNMPYEEIADAVSVIRASGRHVTVEVSGNITADRLPRLAGLGVDLVSMGGLIHQATWADLSMRWGDEEPPVPDQVAP